MNMPAEKINTTIPDETEALVQDAENTLAEIREIKITSATEYDAAGTDLKRIKDKQRELDKTRKSITKPMDDAKKKVMDFFRKPEGFLKEAESILKRAMIAYDDEQRRKAKAEEERLRKQQEEEQARLATEAEEAEKSGDHETANAIIDQAASMPAATVNYEKPKAEGVKTQTRWSAELIDKSEVVKAVAEGKIPLHAIEVNMKFFNQQAVSLKEAFSYPGVKAVSKSVIAA